MTILMLSDAERVRFAVWCRQEAESNYGIAEQLDKLGGGGRVMSDFQRREAAAMTIVAERLAGGESMTIGDSSCDDRDAESDLDVGGASG